jgi:hypothetical protein
LLQQKWRRLPGSISSFFVLRIPQAANALAPLHTTKAPLLHRQNSNARVTKAEEAPAAEHREQEEATDLLHLPLLAFSRSFACAEIDIAPLAFTSLRGWDKKTLAAATGPYLFI